MNEINTNSYFSIKDWKYLSTLEHLSNTEKMVVFISHTLGVSEDEIKTWKPNKLNNAYKDVITKLDELTPAFFPIIDIEGQLYGFSAIGNMTLGEYIDLERLAKSPTENLEQIMAILYRPIKKHKFKGIVWNVKSKYKTAQGKAENLFKYYELEEYNSKDRESRAELLSNLPASFGLGALSFFLVLANTFLLGSSLYSISPKAITKNEMKGIMEAVSMNIGDGLEHFTTYQKVPSYRSQEIRLLQI